nr:hypothetical protein [Candidatus Levybacteria bacterium]
MSDKSELKSVVAEHKPRDEEGHFIHVDKPKAPQKSQDPISKFLGEHTSYSKNQDDLLDVHIGNPLRKIVVLLEDIKKQKAFSFTLKGSLGIAGVALALGVFGVFGGGQILCERGVQSQIGTIKTLNVLETDSSGILILSQFLDYFAPKQTHNKVVLVKNDNLVISLSGKALINNPSSLITTGGYPVIATGNYNSCSQTLTVNDAKGIEIFLR